MLPGYVERISIRSGLKSQLLNGFQLDVFGSERYPLLAGVDTTGHVAERLGSGLQNRVHRFDSGRGLFSSQKYERRSF